MPMMYNFQHQNSHQQQHAQHHPTLQQDHNAHTANGLNHHSTFSGVLSNSTPSFTPTSLQNGHSTISRTGQTQPINEHWAEQLQLYKDSQRAHTAMVEGHAPHHYARIKAGENRGISSAATNATNQENETENHGRTSNPEEFVKRQDWNNMDLSGQGLRVLAAPLFSYTFLTELYVASNKITHLPASIGHLRHLKHLDASNNQLTQLPPELGMCVYLKNLLLFDNNIQTLPNELGSLYQLDMLGIEGNPLDAAMKQVIVEKGTKTLIHDLRESTPSKKAQMSLSIYANLV
jgi:CCR4-NOT transcription complex subunit 6